MGASSGLPVGERVQHYRERANRTQVAVAGLVGITDRYLSLIETGKKTPSAGPTFQITGEPQPFVGLWHPGGRGVALRLAAVRG
ncbi:helix-turn-helix transcriptional regulator [Streptomyces boninensis]|uniref:helix-turn-helix transcriptional regulator n=1 Tax=Streptomyces boninensis TaxID=2039455 RepID=UPI003B20DBAC